MSHDPDRGTGRTTRQMQAAPRNAIFVWCNERLEYPRALAGKVNRRDLKIVGPSFFADYRWRGMNRPIIIDHAAEVDRDRTQIQRGFRACKDYMAVKRLPMGGP